MSVDERRDSIGGVVEAVDEFKSQRDQQHYTQKHERSDCETPLMSLKILNAA
jgi:hypothetical protein